MKFFTSALVFSAAMLSSSVSASEPKTSPEAQQKFWSLTERIALALPGDGRDLQKLIPLHCAHRYLQLKFSASTTRGDWSVTVCR